MAVQDDAREIKLRELFGLEKEEGEGRGGNDAILRINDQTIAFELKSTSSVSRSVTTVRDFSLEHVEKWKHKHWLIGVYDSDGETLEYCLYGSPKKMEPWIQEKADYIGPDLMLAKLAPAKLTLKHLRQVCGTKKLYSLEDAKRIHKQQYSADEYKDRMDFREGRGKSKVEGYTPTRMLDILKDRAEYLIRRGSTLNNPHIPGSYFEGWTQIKGSHAAELRKMVREAIEPAS